MYCLFAVDCVWLGFGVVVVLGDCGLVWAVVGFVVCLLGFGVFMVGVTQFFCWWVEWLDFVGWFCVRYWCCR